MLKAITFDCWGTLLDNNHAEQHARVDYLAQVAGRPQDRAWAAFQEAWSTFSKATLAGLGLPPTMLLNDVLSRLDCALRPTEVQSILRFWEEHILQEPPETLPGALDVLRELRGRGYLIGLVSDTGVTPGHVVRQLLAYRGLRSQIDWLTFSNEMGVCKAHRSAFWATCAALGVEPAQTLHVGDSPEADIDGAHRAGLKAALVLENTHREWGRNRADVVLDTLSDLPAKLDDVSDPA